MFRHAAVGWTRKQEAGCVFMFGHMYMYMYVYVYGA